MDTNFAEFTRTPSFFINNTQIFRRTTGLFPTPLIIPTFGFIFSTSTNSILLFRITSTTFYGVSLYPPDVSSYFTCLPTARR